MALSLSNTIVTLKKYDRSLVKFYPYAGNDTYFINCWMIIKPFMPTGQSFVNNCNIKLYSQDLLETIIVDLKNINKLIFYDIVEFDLTALNVVPVSRDYFRNITKNTKIKDSIQIRNQYRYADFEFNLVKLVIKETTTPVIPASTVLFYKFEDNTNNNIVTDEQGSYNGTATADTQIFSTADKDGNPNSAFAYNTTTAKYVESTMPTELGNEYTYWIRYKRDTSGRFEDVFYFSDSTLQKNVSARLYFNETRIDIRVGQVVYNVLAAATAGVYYDLVVRVKEDEYVKVDIGGISYINASISSVSWVGGNARARIGANPTATSSSLFDGNTDYFLVADKAISDNEMNLMIAL